MYWSTTRQLLARMLFIWAAIASAPRCTAEETEVQGFTEPYRKIDVAAAENGLLAEVLVAEGDRIQARQQLGKLDDAVLRATLAISQRLMESRGAMESAQAELDLQRETLDKLLALRGRNHASPQEIERAQAQVRILQGRLQAARDELEVRVLERQRVLVQLERRRLVSPIDGIVTRVFKQPGEFVSLNEPVVFQVVQLDPLLVVFSVPVQQARTLVAGMRVPVRIGQHSPVRGLVENVSATPDPQSGTTRVRVQIANPDERLPCGATCYLQLGKPAGGQAGARATHFADES